MMRLMLEDIATSGTGEIDEARRLQVLAQLDWLPVAHRSELGHLLLVALDETADVQAGETRWRFRIVRGELGRGGHVQLGFGVCSTFSPMHQGVFGSWVELRHYELQEAIPDVLDLTTVGVLLTPRHDGLRDRDTSMAAISGSIHLSDEDLALYREIWGSSGVGPSGASWRWHMCNAGLRAFASR